MRVAATVAVFATSLLLAARNSLAVDIAIPNSSFESPTALFPTPNINSWQKTPKPGWYDESGGFLWTQLTGAFRNPPASSISNHIDNCDGFQGAWIFAVPEVGLFQDYDSVDWNDSAPTHDFDVTYQVGQSYHLTVGVIGTGGGMFEGATLELSLFYRGANSNRISVITSILTNTPSIFSNNTHFVDCIVDVPTVKATDPWAGKKLGIQILSTVTPELQGGYWDVDNVRLEIGPTIKAPNMTNGQPSFTIFGEPGARFEILSTTNLTFPLASWTSIAIITNATRSTAFIDSAPNFQQRFYRARQLP